MMLGLCCTTHSTIFIEEKNESNDIKHEITFEKLNREKNIWVMVSLGFSISSIYSLFESCIMNDVDRFARYKWFNCVGVICVTYAFKSSLFNYFN